MSFSESLYSWLIYSALVSLAVLAVGSAAALACRQPARRLRIIELSLAGCLIVPWLGMIPGYPQLAVVWRHAETIPAIDQTPPVADNCLAENKVLFPSANREGRADIEPPTIASHPARAIVAPIEPVAALEATTSPTRSWNVATWIVAVYLSGVAMGMVWWLLGVVVLLRVLRTSRPAPDRCRRVLQQIAGSRGDRVRLLTSRLAKQPFAAPWQPSVIVLPENLCNYQQAVRWALAHEWTHIERRHFSAWLAADLVRVLFFYQPLIWWLRRQLRLCQDFVADAGASRQSPEPEDYAEFLAHRAAVGSLHPAMVALGMGFCKSQLYRRVVMVVQNPPLEGRAPRLWTVLVCLVAASLIGILPALSITSETAAQEQDKDASPMKPSAAKNMVFSIGPNKCWGGDTITIQEVRSELGTLAKGDRVTVKGTYTLASRPTATLSFYITEDAAKSPGDSKPGGVTLSIEAGTAPFELTRPINCDGHLHLGFYSSTQCFGTVYFGTEAQMKEIEGWREWVEKPPKPEEPKKSSAAKNIAFAIGPNKFWGGDKITIREVRSELGTLAKGDRVTVKGTYTLASQPTATMCFYITEDAAKSSVGKPGNVAEDALKSLAENERQDVVESVKAGTFPFEMTRRITCDGHLHLVFYSDRSPDWLGTVYFGTEAQMKEIASWQAWVEKPPKPEEPRKSSALRSHGGPLAWQQTDKDKYLAPNFEGFFPDDPQGGARLDRLFQSRDKDSGSDDEILSTVRAGLRRTSQHRTLILGWLGNRYIWGKSPQNPEAIEIMYHAAECRGKNADPYGTRHYAVYFGLSVVEPKTPAILRTLADLCMKVDDPNDLGRVAWGASSQKAALIEYLKPYLTSEDEAERKKAQVVEKIFTGQLKAFAWAGEEMRKRAEAKYAAELPRIKQTLSNGTSQERQKLLRLIASEGIASIMDDSFVAAFASAAEDQDERVRNEIARLVGGRWIWSNQPQNSNAIDLVMRLSEDSNREVRYNAVYFGLSTVRNKDDKVVRRLLEIAFKDREPNLYGRIAWGLEHDRAKTARVLGEYLKGDDPDRSKAAREVFKDMTGQEPPPS